MLTGPFTDVALVKGALYATAALSTAVVALPALLLAPCA